MNGQTQSARLVQEMRPTLIVGLGGTGQEVLVRLKARFLETFGRDALNVIKLAALDTVVEGFQVPLSDGTIVKLDRNSELIDIGNVPTVQVLQNLDFSYPQIKAWLPRDLPGQAIVAGAKQIRPMGRLAFFYHFRKIRDQLENIINSMSNINIEFRPGEVRAGDVRGTNIFVVSSVCGGTGSGIFLDVAYLLRSLCDQLNQPNVHLTGMLVLPQAFAQVPSDQIKANAYAALLELDHFTNGTLGNNFNVEYPGNTSISTPIRPFNICYLVDGVNQEGRTLAGMGELAPLISESIFLQIGSRIGRQAASAFDNIKAIDQRFEDNEGIVHPTAYSGFGMSSLLFPATRIKEVSGRRFATRLITQGLLANTPSTKTVQDEVENFLERTQLRSDLILAAVSRDEHNRPLTLRADQGGLVQAAFDNVQRNELPGQVAARAKAFENKILGDSVHKSLEYTFNQVQANLVQMLADDIARLMNDAARGLLMIGPFLDELRQVLVNNVEQLDATRRDKQEAFGRNTTLVQTSTQRLLNALESWMDLGGSKRKQALNTLLSTHMMQFSLQFDTMRLNSAIRLLSVLITQIDQHRRESDVLIDQLRAAASNFQKADENMTQRWDALQGAREQLITDAHDLETLYATYVKDVNQQLSQLTDPNEAGPISEWRTKHPTYEDISAMLMRFAQRVFSPVDNIRLEDEVMRKRADVAPEARLEKLRETSVPFWSIQMARVPDGGSALEEIVVVAVENKDSTVFQAETTRRGTVPTTTLDRHRVTVLQTRHGVPIIALARIDEYRRLYEQYTKRRGVPLHSFSIGDPRKARTMFALGEAFGLITKDGASNYNLQHSDTHKAPNPLGQGIEEALRRFALSNEFVIRVENMVESVVRSRGADEAGKTVDAYVERPLSVSTRRQEIERDLKVLAREYRQNYL